MPTSAIIGDILALRDAKIAKRTGDAAYGTVRDLYGTVTVRGDARLITAIREGDGKRLAAVTRMVGANLTLEFAANNLQVLADILGLTYSTSGTTPNRTGNLKLYSATLPYLGFAAGADDDQGNKNVFHVWVPKMKITSDTLALFALTGNQAGEFGTVSVECEIFADAAYATGAQNDIQSIDITGSPTGGTFDLSFGSETAADIAYDADAATVQAALEALNNIGSSNVSVSGTNPNFAVTFQGALAQAKMPLLSGDGTSLTGGSSPDVSTSRDQTGSEGQDLIMTMYEDEQGTTPLIPPAL